MLHRIRRRFRPARIRIEAYMGYGTENRLHLKGRVLRDPGVRPVRATAGAARNLANTVRRAMTDEVSNAPVRARFHNDTVEGLSDREGYFDLILPLRRPPPAPPGDLPWHEVIVEAASPGQPGQIVARSTAEVLIPPADAEFGVISDIDDTIVRTEATHWLRMLRIVLLTSAHTRMPFDHVDSLYRALKRGADGDRRNPIFYVSSGPWNFYDLLHEFFRVHDIPRGPMFLRDWEFSPRQVLRMKHAAHKSVRIHHLLDVYPHLRWILIGDSGQEDPEIYRDVAIEYPQRIAAIYIRSVTSPTRDEEVRALAAEVGAFGVEMCLVREKWEAAEHAAAHGFIPASALERMRREDAERATEPDLLERVVNPAARGV